MYDFWCAVVETRCSKGRRSSTTFGVWSSRRAALRDADRLRLLVCGRRSPSVDARLLGMRSPFLYFLYVSHSLLMTLMPPIYSKSTKVSMCSHQLAYWAESDFGLSS